MKYLLENVVSCEMCAVLNKVWMKCKMEKCIFHIPNLFSLLSKPPASLQFEICQIEIRIELSIASLNSTAQWFDIFNFDPTTFMKQKRERVAIFNLLKTQSFKTFFTNQKAYFAIVGLPKIQWNIFYKSKGKFGNISFDARVDKNPSWLILTARSNTERNSSELELKVILMC